MITFKTFLLESANYKAKEGESEVLHHTTYRSVSLRNDFFHPLSHFGTKAAARSRATTLSSGSRRKDDLPGELHTYSVRLKLGKIAKIDDLLKYDAHAVGLSRHLRDLGHITPSQHKIIEKNNGNASEDAELNNKSIEEINGDSHDEIAKALRKNGIHSLSYTNKIEDPGSTSYMITHPSQVRVLKHKYNAKLNIKRGELDTADAATGISNRKLFGR